MSRNPKWTRDEAILALDLYFKLSPFPSSQEHPEVVELSNLLNQLPIHSKETMEEKFRNPNGVYMKLCNFLGFDPSYHGVGLRSASKIDKIIWNEYSDKRDELSSLAKAIRNNFIDISRPVSINEEKADEEEEFPEGRVLTKTHKIKERSGTLPKKKKKTVLNSKGKLECEACGFDFHETYGQIGEGFCECHHNRPISTLAPGEKTKLADLSVVCANCHRMIHKTRPWLSVCELRSLIAKMS